VESTGRNIDINAFIPSFSNLELFVRLLAAFAVVISARTLPRPIFLISLMSAYVICEKVLLISRECTDGIIISRVYMNYEGGLSVVEHCAFLGVVEKKESLETILTFGDDFLPLLPPCKSGWVRIDNERLRRILSVSEFISMGTQIFCTFVSIRAGS